MQTAIKGRLITYPKPEKSMETSAKKSITYHVATALWSIAVAGSFYGIVWFFLMGHR